MLELTINEQVYEFNFNMGFMREINKRVGTPVDGLPDIKKNIGLQYYIAGILDGDVESLVEVLDIANKGNTPRVTKALLDVYIDDESTDLDALFESVKDFLSRANATKNTMKSLLEAIEMQKEQNQ